MSEYNAMREKWNDFVKNAIPPEIPAVIVNTLKLSFYSGAKACQTVLFESVSSQKEEDEKRIKDILLELDEYIFERMQELMKGRKSN